MDRVLGEQGRFVDIAVNIEWDRAWHLFCSLPRSIISISRRLRLRCLRDLSSTWGATDHCSRGRRARGRLGSRHRRATSASVPRVPSPLALPPRCLHTRGDGAGHAHLQYFTHVLVSPPKSKSVASAALGLRSASCVCRLMARRLALCRWLVRF